MIQWTEVDVLDFNFFSIDVGGGENGGRSSTVEDAYGSTIYQTREARDQPPTITQFETKKTYHLRTSTIVNTQTFVGSTTRIQRSVKFPTITVVGTETKSTEIQVAEQVTTATFVRRNITKASTTNITSITVTGNLRKTIYQAEDNEVLYTVPPIPLSNWNQKLSIASTTTRHTEYVPAYLSPVVTYDVSEVITPDGELGEAWITFNNERLYRSITWVASYQECRGGGDDGFGGPERICDEPVTRTRVNLNKLPHTTYEETEYSIGTFTTSTEYLFVGDEEVEEISYDTTTTAFPYFDYETVSSWINDTLSCHFLYTKGKTTQITIVGDRLARETFSDTDPVSEGGGGYVSLGGNTTYFKRDPFLYPILFSDFNDTAPRGWKLFRKEGAKIGNQLGAIYDGTHSELSVVKLALVDRGDNFPKQVTIIPSTNQNYTAYSNSITWRPFKDSRTSSTAMRVTEIPSVNTAFVSFRELPMFSDARSFFNLYDKTNGALNLAKDETVFEQLGSGLFLMQNGETTSFSQLQATTYDKNTIPNDYSSITYFRRIPYAGEPSYRIDDWYIGGNVDVSFVRFLARVSVAPSVENRVPYFFETTNYDYYKPNQG